MAHWIFQPCRLWFEVRPWLFQEKLLYEVLCLFPIEIIRVLSLLGFLINLNISPFVIQSLFKSWSFNKILSGFLVTKMVLIVPSAWLSFRQASYWLWALNLPFHRAITCHAPQTAHTHDMCVYDRHHWRLLAIEGFYIKAKQILKFIVQYLLP